MAGRRTASVTGEADTPTKRPPARNADGLSSRRSVTRWAGSERNDSADEVALEEPLQIRLAGEDVAVTMRTPGNDLELAAGFLFTEGVIGGREHIESLAHCPDESGDPSPNIVNVLPSERTLVEPGRWGRDFLANSSCGLCGKTSIEQVRARSIYPLAHGGPSVRTATLYSLEAQLRSAQTAFQRTGGLHAAALFDLDGHMLALREDIGRHNAVDKVVGRALLDGLLPLDHHILLVSSRASFEIVQKALAAGIGVMAVLSAPSSMAVDLARDAGMTLVAFLRQGRMNVYSGGERVQP